MRTLQRGHTFSSDPPPAPPPLPLSPLKVKEMLLERTGCLWARAMSQVWLGCHSALQ